MALIVTTAEERFKSRKEELERIAAGIFQQMSDEVFLADGTVARKLSYRDGVVVYEAIPANEFWAAVADRNV